MSGSLTYSVDQAVELRVCEKLNAHNISMDSSTSTSTPYGLPWTRK